MALEEKPNVNRVWAEEGIKVQPSEDKISTGWVVERPPYQIQNWLQGRSDAFLKHINQAGIPVWDETTEYTAGKSYVQGSDGLIYVAVNSGSGNDPTNDINNDWKQALLTPEEIQSSLDDIQSAVEMTAQAADAAEESASNAAASENNAATSANTAFTAATTATNSATNASNSAAAALNSQTVAENAASNALAASNYKTNRPSVRLATNGSLPANTYSSNVITISATGVLTVDGLSVSLNDSILVKDEVDTTKNGIYTCTTAGAAGVAAVLTRRSTENTGATLAGACVAVQAGNVYTGWTFLCQQSSITLGTTGVTFSGQPGSVASEAITRLSSDNIISAQLSATSLSDTALRAMVISLSSKIALLESANFTNTVSIQSLSNQLSAVDDIADRADYYVSSIDPNRSDSNSGTSRNSPFASLAPLIAMSAGSLSNKIIALERGGSYQPMDLSYFTADGIVITAYGSGEKPYFDLTDSIPSAWTLHTTGIYKVTLPRLADSKCYTNVFRNAGMPLRKVESIAALSGKGDYVCYISGETTTTLTLYMNAPADPNTDGASYRYTRYAIAINIFGSRNRVDSLWAYGCGAQDGSFKLGGSGGVSQGLNVLSRCRVDWGARHSCYVGSGALPSYVEFCEFYGGANEIETGSVLNASGTANAVVFNALSHTNATCISRYNIYNGMLRPNYIAGTRNNFTGPYGHDGIQGNPMFRFESIGDTYINMQQGPGICAQTNSFRLGSYKNCIDMITPTVNNVTTEVTGTQANSTIDRFINNSSYTINVNYYDNGLIDITDCGAGGAGWVRCGEGTAVANFTLANSSFNIRGCQLVNANKRFIRIRSGSLSINNCTIGPNLAPPVDLLIEAGISGQTCTLSLSNNKWPVGSNFSHSGTTYRGLANWISAGKESGSSYNSLPWIQISDNFNGSDSNLGDTPGWTRLNGSSGDLQRRSSILYGNTSSGTPTVYTRGDVNSTNVYVRYINKGTASAGGAGLRIVDSNNLLFTRASSTQYNILRVTSGTIAVPSGTSNITPAADQEVIVVIRDYTDPNTLATSLRGWIIVDGGLYTAALVDLSSATGLSGELTVGAVARGAIGNLLDDLQFGEAPLYLV